LTRGRVLFVLLAAAVFGLDRLTKYLVVAGIPDNTEAGPFAGFLWIQHIQNPCGAFSLCGPGQLVFLLVSVGVGIAIVIYEFQNRAGFGSHAVLGLILGGVLGNFYDRLLHGSVTDFLALHWWPTFNVADSAISVGVVLLAAGYFWKRPPSG
jgi:signal peptidase II